MEKRDARLTINTTDTPTSSSVVTSRHVHLPAWIQTSLPIATYCAASIIMTVTNKYVVSGGFNMVFLLLVVQVHSNSFCDHYVALTSFRFLFIALRALWPLHFSKASSSWIWLNFATSTWMKQKGGYLSLFFWWRWYIPDPRHCSSYRYPSIQYSRI